MMLSPNRPSPPSIMLHVPGSGVVTWLKLTSARSAKGGSLGEIGVPTERNDSASLVPVAVKLNVWYIQPVKPWLGLVTAPVFSVWLPRLTCHCSVVMPVKLYCCAAAQ